ncbi:MAG: HAMP domain-containing sensor histidine kinase [Acidobacteria bacterium]|nr:HAMP domain-containing sensor histidine kinase [Acidobacteriota bacterium]
MVNRTRRQTLLAWTFVSVLVLSSLALAALEFRAIMRVSQAEGERVRRNLRIGLDRVSRDFNDQIERVTRALALPEPPRDQPAPSAAEREAAYLQRYQSWRDSGGGEWPFVRVARAIRSGDTLELRELDPGSATYRMISWPAEWAELRRQLEDRVSKDAGGRAAPFRQSPGLLEFPYFGQEADGDRPRELEWLIFELNLDLIRSTALPDLLRRHLGDDEGLPYSVDVVLREAPEVTVFRSDPNRTQPIGASADASVGLLDISPPLFRRGGRPPRRERPTDLPGPPPGREEERGGPRRPPEEGRARWVLSARHQAGSIEALIRQSRIRNIVLTSALLVLMLTTVGALIWFTRRAQQLAAMQMEFVASISHELRTPLTVIRTAAHNLVSGVVRTGNTAQAERYGQIIQNQTGKLVDMVEQVLRFANAEAGRSVSRLEPFPLEGLLSAAAQGALAQITAAECQLETSISPEAEIAWVRGDYASLEHALINLLTNAAKYGSSGKWIGLAADVVRAGEHAMIEIRVSDHGPGVAAAEAKQIFEPFFRGRLALEDQIHGTGLGLSLVKRVVEGHAGTIVLNSPPARAATGAEFVLRLPAATEGVNEFANPTG